MGPLLGIYLSPGSRVRVQVPEYGSSRVQIPKYGSRFSSTDFENIIEIASFFQISLKNVLSFILGLILDAVLIEGPFMGNSI